MPAQTLHEKGSASSGDAESGPAVVPRMSPRSPLCPQAVPGSHCSASPGILCPGWERTWQHIPWDAATNTPDPVPGWSPLSLTMAQQTLSLAGPSSFLEPLGHGRGRSSHGTGNWISSGGCCRVTRPGSGPMPRWSCRATCQAGAATCSGVGSHPEPFQLCTLPQRTQIHPCGDGSGWHRRDLGAEGGAVTPALAQWPWWLREGCGATSLCSRQSWCDHAMPSRHGHVPCLCVALPWAWICPTHPSPCGLPVPHLPWLSSTLVPLPLGALPGHRQ